MEEILELTDSSFKYVLIFFNFVTILIIYLHNRRNKSPKRHHILFVTAHPDDQSMFFRPTILGLKDEYFVHLLCLSNGGSKKREKELASASENLGIHKFYCVQDPELQDGQDKVWNQGPIKRQVLKYANENSIRAIFSFDSNGISGHANHIAIFKALNTLKSKLAEGQITKNLKESPEQLPTDIKFYALESVNILRKYSGICDILVALVKDYSWINFNVIGAWKSIAVHESQFTWFRKLWVVFSRYNYMNTYQRTFINIVNKEQ